MPMFFVLLILGGMGYPCVSAALGLVYIVSRYFYFTGYATGDPKNRLTLGRFGSLALLGLMICTVSFGINLLRP
ncbi:Detected protein of confused Function [Hibiscus syriacus]|uniref:Detected protein of confused Function n=2 Tax=Hibiscus syriacus TaxID=106335 RepID=A0A6A2ZY71_HIBSY|nr:Detected protein of confused Function [Hibiscus syriacus]